ncbi:MAG: DUF1292 domain-containing protein [Clostridium sp.]
MEKDTQFIDLLDEQGNEVKFEVISFFSIDDLGNEYVVVTPAGEESEEAFVLKVLQDEEGNESLVAIEDENEFELVEEAYNLLMQED